MTHQNLEAVPVQRVGVGSILYLSVYKEEGHLMCKQQVGNPCKNYCRLDDKGFDHPIVVIAITKSLISDLEDTEITFVQVS